MTERPMDGGLVAVGEVVAEPLGSQAANPIERDHEERRV